MMASLAEQRRFLLSVDKMSTSKLAQIAEDLMEIIKKGHALPSDEKFHEQICYELFTRMKK